jgi:hypothetical protein
VTFDIVPEQSDEPPAAHVDQDLEAALGELARGEPPGGLDDKTPLVIPWELIGFTVLGALVSALVAAFAIKGFRRLATANHRQLYRAVLDLLSDLGAPRLPGESRERHAQRLAARAPSFVPLTHAHLALTLGHDDEKTKDSMRELAKRTKQELSRSTPLWVRLGGFFNPIGWWFTR